MLTILCAALLAPTPTALGTQDVAPPPGMVRLVGGRTKIGSDRKDIQNLIDEVPSAREVIRPLDGETPQISMNIAPFFLGRTEVSNEQYLAFVKSTGHRPPKLWGMTAINDIGRAEFFEKRNEAKEAGQNVQDWRFDDVKWWSKNWQDHEWSVPAKDLLAPVCFVDYKDVTAYCTWAGLRLPTEFEWQFASRGKGEARYAWGDEWEDGKYANTRENRAFSKLMPIGTYVEGVSQSGVHDLAGNVWEWTSSPYKAYKTPFKPGVYKYKKKKLEAALPKWNVSQRVVMGGSYLTDRIVARCTTRRGSEQSQITAGVGFRVAASPRIGEDVAQNLLRFTVRKSAFLADYPTAWGPGLSVAADRWAFLPGTEAPKAGRAQDYVLPQGYGVITGYEYLLFVPVQELGEAKGESWRRKSLDKPQMIGVLATTEAMAEPKLNPGTYFVLYRSKGKIQRQDKPDPDENKDDKKGAGVAQEPTGQEEVAVEADPADAALPYDIKENNLLFVDSESGEIVAVQEVSGAPKFDKVKNLSGWKVETVKESQKGADGKPIKVDVDHLILTAEIPIVTRGKCYPFSIDFKPALGVTGKVWRGMRK
jgi:formylglycine-generating enzyme required for sulfatase activity